MTYKSFDTVSTIDTAWDGCVAQRMVALISEAKPTDVHFSTLVCEFVRHALWEYAEQGLSLRDIVLIARKAATQLQVGNTYRFAFIGIVSDAAASLNPQRTRSTKQGKSSHFIAQEVAKLAHAIQFDDAGKQMRTPAGAKVTIRAAVQGAQDTFSGLLPNHLVPTKKTIKEHLQRWRASEGVQGPYYRDE